MRPFPANLAAGGPARPEPSTGSSRIASQRDSVAESHRDLTSRRSYAVDGSELSRIEKTVNSGRVGTAHHAASIVVGGAHPTGIDQSEARRLGPVVNCVTPKVGSSSVLNPVLYDSPTVGREPSPAVERCSCAGVRPTFGVDLSPLCRGKDSPRRARARPPSTRRRQDGRPARRTTSIGSITPPSLRARGPVAADREGSRACRGP